jgi:MFS family permease
MPIFCDVVPPASRSTTYGVFNLANTLGGGVSVIIAGILKTHWGIAMTMSMFSLMLLISLSLVWVAVKWLLPKDMKRMNEKLVNRFPDGGAMDAMYSKANHQLYT